MLATRRHARTTAFIFAVSAPAPVFANMAPDIGVGALGAALGVTASLLLVLVSLAWYPLRRLNRRMRARAIRPAARAPDAGIG